MKKMVLLSILFVLFVTVGVSIYAVINLLSLSSEEASVSVATNQNANLSLIEQYAIENYPDYTAEYNAQSKTLTLKKQTEFSVESAPSIYTDPTSYLSQTQIFALDISLACDEPDLVIVLTYVSKDGEPMLSVGSNGTIIKHWK